MDNGYMIVKNAIGSNGFVSTDTSAGYVNPTYWNRQLLVFLEEALVVSKYAKVYTDLLGQDGATLNVTIDSTPTAAAAVAESDDATVSAQAHTQVTFTPTEYAKAYQLHDKEARRAFVDEMGNMVKKIGYALALARDDAAVTLLQASAGNSVMVNSKTATSALASSDTLDYDTIVSGATEIRKDYLFPKALFLSPGALGQLSKDSQFSYVNQAGTDETLHGGKIGRIYGMDVYWTTQIAPSTHITTNLMIGVDQMGESPFGIAIKSLPTIEKERHALGRYTDIVGVEEWDIEMLRTAGVCKVINYE